MIPHDPTDPNARYNGDRTPKFILSSTTDANQFCNKYNHDNNYSGLHLGDVIQINDGAYNATWYICGFDVESNKIASDGSTYDNGYGIMLIPETKVTTAQMNTNNNINTPYIKSYIHTSTLVSISNSLKNIFNTHLINRRVLLSSSVNGYAQIGSTAYTWTTAYATLPSVGQLTGTFASHNNKYDDGEANYKLPLFNYIEYKTGSPFWSRGVWGNYGSGYSYWCINGNGVIEHVSLSNNFGVRPLIYIR